MYWFVNLKKGMVTILNMEMSQQYDKAAINVEEANIVMDSSQLRKEKLGGEPPSSNLAP